MKRRLFSIVTSVLLVAMSLLALTACGNDKEAEATPTAEVEETQAPEADGQVVEDDAQAPDADQGEAPDEEISPDVPDPNVPTEMPEDVPAETEDAGAEA